MVMKIYGIKNCDTVRKSLKWAEEMGLNHQFHDFRKEPVSSETVTAWLTAAGADILINKRGTTYRNLDEGQKKDLEGPNVAALLAEQPTLMKRPIFEMGGGQYIVGFKDKEKAAVLEAR